MASTETAAPRRRRPWWMLWLGPVPDGVDDGAVRLLGAVSLALLFEEYDLAIVTSALKQIAADLGVSERAMAFDLAMIRLGALPAFVLLPFADRLGRKPVFRYSVLSMGVLTFATAFSRDATQFVLLQAVTRACYVTGSATAFVIMAEELPAAHRGWGMGTLAALGACGHGLGALMFSQIDRLPFGWRALYALGLVPVLLTGYFAARVRETRRFEQHARERSIRPEAEALYAPLFALGTHRPWRTAAVAASGFVMAFAVLPSFQFSGYFTQTALGFSPAIYAAMVMIGGGVGILGNLVGGRLGDALGRKRVGVVLLAGFPLASVAFYRGGASGALLGWVALVFCMMGGRLILRALSTELFPTAQRGAAAGLFAVAEAMGAVAGLLAIDAYQVRETADLARVIPLVAAVTLLSALLVVVFPETRARELEEISGG